MSSYRQGTGAAGTGAGSAAGAGGVGRRIEEAVELIEMELRHTIGYVNDAIVPQVRRESISAMRSLAEKLQSLADRVDKAAQGQASSGPQRQQSPSQAGDRQARDPHA